MAISPFTLSDEPTNQAMGTSDLTRLRSKLPDTPYMRKRSWSPLLSLALMVMNTATAEDAAVVTYQIGTTHEVINVVLPLAPDRFLKAFILDESFTHNFFQKSKDKDVRLGPWIRTSPADGRGRATTAMTRDVEYSHPVKTKFPGMPSHAKTFKRQEYAYNSRRGILELEEHLRFEGIPRAEYFAVETAWKVRSLDGKKVGKKNSSEVTVSLRVNFSKKTVLRKTIENQTLVEQGESLRNWMAAARETLADQGSTGGVVGGAEGFRQTDGGVVLSLPSCQSEGIRSFFSRKFGGLWQKMRSWSGDDQPAAAATAL